MTLAVNLHQLSYYDASQECFNGGGRLVALKTAAREAEVIAALHAAGITDTLGTILLLTGLAMQADAGDALKLLLVFSFLFFTSPVAAHSLANAAIKSGDKPRLGAFNDD